MKLFFFWILFILIILTTFTKSLFSTLPPTMTTTCLYNTPSNIPSCIKNHTKSHDLPPCNDIILSYPTSNIKYEPIYDTSLKLNFTTPFFEIYHTDKFNIHNSFSLANRLKSLAIKIETQHIKKDRIQKARIMLNEIMTLTTFNDNKLRNVIIFKNFYELNTLFCKAINRNEFVYPCFIYKKVRRRIEYTIRLIKSSIENETEVRLDNENNTIDGRSFVVFNVTSLFINDINGYNMQKCDENESNNVRMKSNYIGSDDKNNLNNFIDNKQIKMIDESKNNTVSVIESRLLDRLHGLKGSNVYCNHENTKEVI